MPVLVLHFSCPPSSLSLTHLIKNATSCALAGSLRHLARTRLSLARAATECLPDLYYAKWEAVVANLQPLLLSKRIRPVVDRLPILSTEHLHTDAEWRRAYVVLVFMLHSYVWGGERPAEV